jgi:hypothetical protein
MKNSIIENGDRAAILRSRPSFLGMTEKLRKETLIKATLTLLVSFSPAVAGANLYVQHNLVSDIPGLADQSDARLLNPGALPPAQPAPSGLRTITLERRPYTTAPVSRSRRRRRWW